MYVDIYIIDAWVSAHVLSCVQLFATPWAVVHQAPHPGNIPGKITIVVCHFLLQGIFLTQELNHISCISCIGRKILYNHLLKQTSHPTPAKKKKKNTSNQLDNLNS